MNQKGYGRKWPWPNLRYYPGICLEALRKTMKNLSQSSWSLGQDLNPGPPDPGVLLLGRDTGYKPVRVIILNPKAEKFLRSKQV
jgi:hypothetical protein